MTGGARRHRLLLHLRRADSAPGRGKARGRRRWNRRVHIATSVAHDAVPVPVAAAATSRLYQVAVGSGGQPVSRHPIHYASVTYFELTWGAVTILNIVTQPLIFIYIYIGLTLFLIVAFLMNYNLESLFLFLGSW